MAGKEQLAEFRWKVRRSEFTGHTSGLFPEFAQANIIILPQSEARDFAEFCAKNPTPCPVIHQGEPGDYRLSALGELDVRTDIPAYYVYRGGELSEERTDISELWGNDFVCFCLGCSFTFDTALIQGGIELRHVNEGRNVAMYKTNIPLAPAGAFQGKMVVSMRWIDGDQVELARDISARYPDFHGAPVHIGRPEEIGINAIERPDYGDYVTPKPGQISVFWGCGVTPQNCLAAARLPLAITHKPGSMLLTDLTQSEILKKTQNQ